MKQAAIFDLDGTLVSTVGLHEGAWQELFKKYGIELTPEELREQSGKKNTTFVGIIAGRRGVALDAQKLSDEKDATVMEHLRSNPAKVFPGAAEFLQELKKRGVKNVLATSATKQTALLLGRELLQFFDASVFGEDVKNGKPDPEIFLKAAVAVNARPEDCVVFEDAKSGVEAAKQGGFLCIARDEHRGQDLSKADLIISGFDPPSIISYLESR